MQTAPMSDSERVIVQELKVRLDEVIRIDNTLQSELSQMKILRFLRGRNGDVEKTFNSLVMHLRWRKDLNVNNMTASMCGSQIANRVAFTHSYCKMGRPVVYVFADRHNGSDRNIDEVRNFIIYSFEYYITLTKPDDEKITMVFELSKLTLKCIDIEIIKMLINILQFQYPETLGVAVILHSPWIFNTTWNIIQPWLDPVTAAKVRFINSDALTDLIDYDALPQELVERFKSLSEKAKVSSTSTTTTILPLSTSSTGLSTNENRTARE